MENGLNLENSLVTISNNMPVTTSLKIAEVFEKKHRHVLDSIRDVIKQNGGMPKIGQTPMFQETTYIHEQNGQEYPMYYLNRDGFTLLAMGFTGSKALKFKLAYIEAFNKMEAALKEFADDKDAKWFETRFDGKKMRRQETDAIKLFIEYARSQGCTWKDYKFYSNLSIICNLGVGLPQKNGRNSATKNQLMILGTLEGTTIPAILRQGIIDDLHWTQIWAKVQQQINIFLDVTFQGRLPIAPSNIVAKE